MRVSQAAILLAVAAMTGVSSGFSPSPVFGVSQSARLKMSEVAVEDAEATETEAEEQADPEPQPVPSGLTMQFVKKSIDNLTAENFAETLSKIEPYLINDAGITIYKKSIRRIGTKAKMLETTVPEGYAKEAFCTAKRRAKQDAFIKVKEEERLAAEAEAAEAAATAEAEAAEGEAPAEEAPAE